MAFDKRCWGNPSWKVVHVRLADNTILCDRQMSGASGWKFSDTNEGVTCKRCKRIQRGRAKRLAKLGNKRLFDLFVQQYTDSVIDADWDNTSHVVEVRCLVKRLVARLAERMSSAELRAYLEEHTDA